MWRKIKETLLKFLIWRLNVCIAKERNVLKIAEMIVVRRKLEALI